MCTHPTIFLTAQSPSVLSLHSTHPRFHSYSIPLVCLSFHSLLLPLLFILTPGNFTHHPASGPTLPSIQHPQSHPRTTVTRNPSNGLRSLVCSCTCVTITAQALAWPTHPNAPPAALLLILPSLWIFALAARPAILATQQAPKLARLAPRATPPHVSYTRTGGGPTATLAHTMNASSKYLLMMPLGMPPRIAAQPRPVVRTTCAVLSDILPRLLKPR